MTQCTVELLELTLKALAELKPKHKKFAYQWVGQKDRSVVYVTWCMERALLLMHKNILIRTGTSILNDLFESAQEKFYDENRSDKEMTTEYALTAVLEIIKTKNTAHVEIYNTIID